MPGTEHETIRELILQRPQFVAELLRDLDQVPIRRNYTVRVNSADFSQTMSTEYQADGAFALEQDGVPVVGFVVEEQRQWSETIAKQKRNACKVYVAAHSARLNCPVGLVFICQSATVARGSAKPIHVAVPNGWIQPLVLGPDQIPVITDMREAVRRPEVAFLSGLVHAKSAPDEPVVLAALAAIDTFEAPIQGLLADVLFAHLGIDRRKVGSTLMLVTDKYEFKSAFMRDLVTEAEAKGRAEGEAKALLRILANRKIDVSDPARERILACTEPALLEAWLDRALDATSIDDVLDE